jgi:hypothetical protein
MNESTAIVTATDVDENVVRNVDCQLWYAAMKMDRERGRHVIVQALSSHPSSWHQNPHIIHLRAVTFSRQLSQVVTTFTYHQPSELSRLHR